MNNFVCSNCDKSFKYQKRYESHKKDCDVKEIDYNFTCKWCSKNMSTKYNMQRHLQSCKKYIELIKPFETKCFELEQKIKDLETKLASAKNDTIINNTMNNNTMNISINTNQSQNKNTGISNKELAEEILLATSNYLNNPYLINDSNFSMLLANLPIVKNNTKITDTSRYKTQFFDKDKNLLVNDYQMCNLVSKSINVIPQSIIESFETYTNSEVDNEDYKPIVRSKVFIEQGLKNKEQKRIVDFGKRTFKNLSQSQLLITNKSNIPDYSEEIEFFVFELNDNEKLIYIYFSNIYNLGILIKRWFDDILSVSKNCQSLIVYSNNKKNEYKVQDFLYIIKSALRTYIQKDQIKNNVTKCLDHFISNTHNQDIIDVMNDEKPFSNYEMKQYWLYEKIDNDMDTLFLNGLLSEYI